MRYVSMIAALCFFFAILAFGVQPAKAADEFSVMGFSLSDTPRQIIDKAVADGFKVTTTFPVYNAPHVLHVSGVSMPYYLGWNSRLLAKFFHYHISRGFVGLGDTIYGKVDPNRLQQTDEIEVRKDFQGIYLSITFYYYTLPGGSPKVLIMQTMGKILNDVPDVFTKRYGAPQEKGKEGMVWMSETECAMLGSDIVHVNPDPKFVSLTIISKPGYEELFGKYLAGLKAEQDAKEKAAAEQQKAKEKALKDKL